MNILNWLEKWYQSNCDTTWEHIYGIKISTLDNPGWRVTIDLAETSVERKIFKDININNSDIDWITCRVKNGIFEGFGDSSKLGEILEIFKEWVGVG